MANTKTRAKGEEPEHQTAKSPRRVLLKLSGEALMGGQDYGLDAEIVDRIAAEVAIVADLNVEICLVIGGGNIFRGVSGAAKGMDRASAD